MSLEIGQGNWRPFRNIDSDCVFLSVKSLNLSSCVALRRASRNFMRPVSVYVMLIAIIVL